jgi:hypothetical protein
MYNTKNEPQCKLWTSGNDASVWASVVKKIPLVRNIDSGGSKR